MSLSEAYDKLYQEAKEIFDRNNPCDFKDGLCRREREKNKDYEEIDPFCCCNGKHFTSQNDETGTHCKHFVDGKGCSVKSLSCMTWICDSGYFEDYEDVKRLFEIEAIASDLGLFFPRHSKEETMKEVLTK